MNPVEGESTLERFRQFDSRLPTQHRTNKAEVRIVVPDIDRLSIIGILTDDKSASAIDAYEQLRKLAQAHDLITAQVEYPAVCFIPPGCKQKGIHCIVNVGEIAKLFAAPDLESLTFHQKPYPDSKKGLTSVFDSHPRSDG